MENPLARKFDLGALLRFAAPNVLMMVTLSLYVIVDGVFISRILGTTALSAANMVYPLICLEMASAIMVATGGSAIIARKLGEGRAEEARRDLSFLTAVVLLMGAAVAVGGNLFAGRIVALLGASPAQFALCMDYARMLFCFAPAFFLQTAFQTFFVTAGRPALGLAVTLAAGLANIALDYAFMGSMQMGIAGAALATGIGYCIPALAGVAFFALHRGGALYFVRPKADGGVLLHACANGSSEMVSNLANAVTTFLFNAMFLRYYGEDGVAAITIILYFQYIFTALYFGYSNGIAPVVSFKYGCGDKRQLKQIFRSSLLFIVGSAVASWAIPRCSCCLQPAFYRGQRRGGKPADPAAGAPGGAGVCCGGQRGVPHHHAGAAAVCGGLPAHGRGGVRVGAVHGFFGRKDLGVYLLLPHLRLYGGGYCAAAAVLPGMGAVDGSAAGRMPGAGDGGGLPGPQTEGVPLCVRGAALLYGGRGPGPRRICKRKADLCVSS